MDNKQVEINLERIKEKIDNLNNHIVKISNNQEDMNRVLIENTIIVREHERRSTAFESWAEVAKENMSVMTITLNKIAHHVDLVEDQIEPIKQHVDRVNKIVNFINGIPAVVKVIVGFITILSALYGLFIFISSTGK
jgi:methyl-accepting chemotaxis protein